jgi:hypothetical protein
MKELRYARLVGLLSSPHPSLWYLYSDVGLAWSHDPESYAGGSIPAGSVSHTRHVKLDEKNKLRGLSDRFLSARLVPSFADTACRVVSATDPHGRILKFLDRSSYFFFSK